MFDCFKEGQLAVRFRPRGENLFDSKGFVVFGVSQKDAAGRPLSYHFHNFILLVILFFFVLFLVSARLLQVTAQRDPNQVRLLEGAG